MHEIGRYTDILNLYFEHQKKNMTDEKSVGRL